MEATILIDILIFQVWEVPFGAQTITPQYLHVANYIIFTTYYLFIYLFLLMFAFQWLWMNDRLQFFLVFPTKSEIYVFCSSIHKRIQRIQINGSQQLEIEDIDESTFLT
jgi:hypothetical protein